MDKKNWQQIKYMMTIATLFISIISLAFAFLQEDSFKNTMLISIVIIVFLIDVIVFLFLKLIKKSNSEIEKLDELISYNKKRKEIEQEINRLTYELVNSDVSQYIDINRLVFDGQNKVDFLDNNNFFDQFGIKKENIKIKEDSAIFLTPFDKEGNKLFEICRRIFADVNIFLQRSDNRVEKDDILMNIITMIVQSELVVVNINGRNPNVYYELGIAHAIGKKTILISEAKFSLEDIGFDIRQKKIIIYKDIEDLEKQLLSQIGQLRNKN